MATSTKKTIPCKTVPGKSVPKKSVTGKSVPKKTFPITEIPNSTLNSPVNRSDGTSVSSSLSSLLPSDSESLDSYTTLPPCSHLSKVLNSSSREAVLKTYAAALRIVVIGIQSQHSGGSGYYNRKGLKVNINLLQKVRSRILRCKECDKSLSKGEHVIRRNNLYMCLQCTSIGCWSEGHSYTHAKSSGHVFGINPDNGEFMCLKCGDLVSHPTLERIRYNSFKSAGVLKFSPVLPYFETEHNLKNYDLIHKFSRIPSYKETTGLRGFINLGSTCFMSSVLQTLIHNPYLKRYYLSNAHSDCPKPHSECMSCCVSDIYQDFFTNPAILGYGLTSFIEAAWKVKRSLAGYSEQDAHEFWQFLVHQIHKNDTKNSKYIQSKESTPSLDSQNFKSSNVHCDCIIHKTFSGTLESTLTCSVCGQSRKIEDPMLDVSLEIQNKQGSERTSLKDLHSCFRKYTRKEELDVLYECDSCEKKTRVTKRLRLNKLPPVLSIQLKRFEHIGVSSKLEYHIDIPTVLDVKEYVSETNNGPIPNYELFGVICHLGNVNTGHYLAYAKNINGAWFKFDDATITRVTEAEVKKVNGYMLVYCMNEYI